MKIQGLVVTTRTIHLFRFCSILLTLCFIAITLNAQIPIDEFPALGDFQRNEIELKKVDFEPEASAVVLFDAGRATYGDQHQLLTTHRKRIKILNDKGKDYATISIPFYSRNDFEHIENIRAVIATYDENNNPTVTQLQKREFYYNKVNAYWSEVKFTMPNVKPGSIIDYEYTSNMKSFFALEEWDFQSDLPTLKSWYKLDILPNTEFRYMVMKINTLPIAIDNKTQGTVAFEMKNIPALNEEPYMDSRKDNLQRVTFQLFSYSNGAFKSKYLNKWDDVAYELLGEQFLGGQLSKSLPGTEDFIKKTKILTTEKEKVTAVANYVQEHISWNGFTSKYSSDGIKKAWDKGKGSDGEINMIFINILRDVGIDAVPIIASDRYHQKVDLTYPYIDQFNKTVTYIYLKDENYVVDASDTKTPWNFTPVSLLNTYGYVLDKKRKGAIFIGSNKEFYESMINVYSVLSPEGILSGSASISNGGYGRLERKNDHKFINKDKFIEKYYLLNGSDLSVDSLNVSNVDEDSKPLEQKFDFRQTISKSGEFSFLNYHLFTGFSKNPFTTSTRFSDINMAFPRRFLVSETIEIPDNYTIDFLPKNKTLVTPDTSLILKRIISQTNGTITCQLKLDINKTYWDRNEYVSLKNFYKLLYDLLDEQIVLKAKK